MPTVAHPTPPAVEAMPDFIAPMLARIDRQPPGGDGWAFEFKWDGVRAVARCDGDKLTLWARRGRDISQRYPELHAAVPAVFKHHRAIVDGEVIALGPDDRPSFTQLQRRMHVSDRARAIRLSRQIPVWFMAFDVLWLDGTSTLAMPYVERRALLETMELDDGAWRTPPYQRGHGGAMLASARDLGLEGIVAKQMNSPYVSGARSDAWRKIRIGHRQEFVVGGWTPGRGDGSRDIGSLLLGYYSRDGLHYAGLVGTGFDRTAQQMLGPVLQRLARSASPFIERIERRDARFVEPVLVVDVRFTQWTPDAVLRHAVYLGLREDKDPRDVVRET